MHNDNKTLDKWEEALEVQIKLLDECQNKKISKAVCSVNLS